MGEPTVALGVKETQMVAELTEEPKSKGLGMIVLGWDPGLR